MNAGLMLHLMIDIVSTLRGGGGSGATPEIVVFAIMPFTFEGKKREYVARNAISKMQSSTDTVIILNNNVA